MIRLYTNGVYAKGKDVLNYSEIRRKILRPTGREFL